MLLTLMHNLKQLNLLLLITILALPRWSWAGQEQHLCTDTLDEEYRVIYEINYSYDKYPAERKIAYQYYLDHEAKYYSDLKPEQLGIDLFDIDNDGEKEIFLFVNADWCPRSGCPYAIIKKAPANSKGFKYSSIESRYSIEKSCIIQVLEHKSHDYHNIAYKFQDNFIVIHQWNGSKYEEKLRKKIVQKKEKNETTL